MSFLPRREVLRRGWIAVAAAVIGAAIPEAALRRSPARQASRGDGKANLDALTQGSTENYIHPGSSWNYAGPNVPDAHF